MGWKADDDLLFGAASAPIRVTSLSLGARGLFQIQDRNDWENDALAVTLGNGDLLLTEGNVQQHYDHRFSMQPWTPGERLSLTWRWVRNHDEQCPKRNLSAHQLQAAVYRRVAGFVT